MFIHFGFCNNSIHFLYKKLTFSHINCKFVSKFELLGKKLNRTCTAIIQFQIAVCSDLPSGFFFDFELVLRKFLKSH